METIRIGSTGPVVLAWQQFLRGQDLYMGEVTGTFDDPTEKATEEYQASHGLTPDGIVGNQTLGHAMVEGFVVVSNTDPAKTGPNWPPVDPNVTPATLPLRQQLFGTFQYVPAPSAANPEAITILGNWAAENIVEVHIPQLEGILGAPASGVVPFHKAAANQLVAMFQGWQDAGLMDRVKTFAGTWAPRFVRGSRTNLSNHAWGTAIDLNAGWNPLGGQPALVGHTGCTRELVDVAVQNGFYWGGWGWGSGRFDGMHFEVCRITP